MFETFGFEDTTSREASVWLALAIGLAFGVLAEITRFCFRRAIVGDDRRAALGVWLTALATALIGTQAAVASGLIGFDGHRFLASDLPVLAIVTGGLLFGAGMVLARGCASRLSVLAGSGNLRAVLVLAVFAIAAHATMKGVLAPLRMALGEPTLSLGGLGGLSALPGGALFWTALVATGALFVAARSGNRPMPLALAALLGLLVPAAWVGTGFVLFDDFDPIPMVSLAFTQPAADTLFWGVAATSIEANFGVGLIGGVLAGAAVSSLIAGRFAWQSFDSPAQTGRYMLGAVLMGVGGVLAGGCTVGAGLAGVPTLGFAALLAILSIAAGAKLTDAGLTRVTQPARGYGGQATTPLQQPAE